MNSTRLDNAMRAYNEHLRRAMREQVYGTSFVRAAWPSNTTEGNS